MAFSQIVGSLLLWLLWVIIEKPLNRAPFLPLGGILNFLASLYLRISFTSVLDMIYMHCSTELPQFVFNVVKSQRDLVNKMSEQCTRI